MSRYEKIKKRVYEVIGPAAKGDYLSYIVDIFIAALAVLSSAAVIADLIGVSPETHETLVFFENITVAIFLLEYLLRLWVCDLHYTDCKNKFSALKEYITSFDSFIDLISIFSILFNGIPSQMALLRLFKLIKLTRLVKLSEHFNTSDALRVKTEKVKKRVNEIIDTAEPGDTASKVYDVSSLVLILLSVFFIIVETFPIPREVHRVLYDVEILIAVLFSVEYVLRVWTAPLDYPDLRPDKARMCYIFSFMSLVDLLSILPVFIAGLPSAAGIVKIFRICKIVRLVKASRYVRGIANFGAAIRKKRKQIIFSVITVTIMIVICSVMMYSFENKSQPEVFKNGLSGVYYSINLLTGSSGSIEPATNIGKALATLMLLLGGCMIGVPVTIVSTGFEDMIAEQAGEEDDGTDVYELMKAYDSLSEDGRKRFRAYVETSEDP